MSDLLRISLRAAVPLWIDDMRDWDPERRARAAAACSEQIAMHGCILMLSSERRGESFNKLALGVACAAYQPGGITFLGDHWEASA